MDTILTATAPGSRWDHRTVTDELTDSDLDLASIEAELKQALIKEQKAQK